VHITFSYVICSFTLIKNLRGSKRRKAKDSRSSCVGEYRLGSKINLLLI
jgi:hypothetical protein